jgi:hypothetical protein
LTLPKLLPGLYWAVAAGAADGAEHWAPSTTVRPFFVAQSDEAALGSGTHPAACTTRGDLREAARALLPCLALAVPPSVVRWVALDGAPAHRAAGARARARGLAIAVAAVVSGFLLELVLLARTAQAARARIGGMQARPPWVLAFAVAVLVALLGFALLAAFLLRVA